MVLRREETIQLRRRGTKPTFLKPTRATQRRQELLIETLPTIQTAADKRKEALLLTQGQNTRSRGTPQVEELQRKLGASQNFYSPLKNRPSPSIDECSYSPSRTQTITVAYGTEAFKQHYSRRRDANVPLPCDSPWLRTFTDSQLLKNNRDYPAVDERRISRSTSCLLPGGDDRIEGLNGEEEGALSQIPRKYRCSDITKFRSHSVDPHAVPQAALRTSCHRKINIDSCFAGSEVKAQLRRRDHARLHNLMYKPPAGRPAGGEPDQPVPVTPTGNVGPQAGGLEHAPLGPAAGCFGWQMGGRMNSKEFHKFKAMARDENGKYIM